MRNKQQVISRNAQVGCCLHDAPPTKERIPTASSNLTRRGRLEEAVGCQILGHIRGIDEKAIVAVGGFVERIPWSDQLDCWIQQSKIAS